MCGRWRTDKTFDLAVTLAADDSNSDNYFFTTRDATMSCSPCLLNPDGTFVPLTLRRKSRIDDSVTEDFLQRAVDASPELMPYHDLLPTSRRIVSLGMEIPLSFPGGRNGKIDNLLITDDGHLVVVEMKLWRNPEAIREVVGQIFHYGLTLESMSLSEIEAAIARCEKGNAKLANGQSLIEYAVEQFDIDDERAFSTAVGRHLRNGELLYLIAGDGIHVSVDAIAMWINARSGSPFRFGLVELDIYETARSEQLIVPRIRIKTAEIGRHVVEVKVSGPGSESVQVHIDEQIREQTGALHEERREVKKATTTIAENEARIRELNEPDAADAALHVLHELQNHAFASFARGTEVAIGVMCESGTIQELVRLGKHYIYVQSPYPEGSTETQDFKARANAVLPFFKETTGNTAFPNYRDLHGHEQQVLKFILAEREKFLEMLE